MSNGERVAMRLDTFSCAIVVRSEPGLCSLALARGLTGEGPLLASKDEEVEEDATDAVVEDAAATCGALAAPACAPGCVAVDVVDEMAWRSDPLEDDVCAA